MYKAISNIPRLLMPHNKIDMFNCRSNNIKNAATTAKGRCRSTAKAMIYFSSRRYKNAPEPNRFVEFLP